MLCQKPVVQQNTGGGLGTGALPVLTKWDGQYGVECEEGCPLPSRGYDQHGASTPQKKRIFHLKMAHFGAF